MFCEETDFATLDTEDVLLEIDACLVRFQHVEAEEEVDVSALSYVEQVVYSVIGVGALTSMIVIAHGK